MCSVVYDDVTVENSYDISILFIYDDVTAKNSYDKSIFWVKGKLSFVLSSRMWVIFSFRNLMLVSGFLLIIFWKKYLLNFIMIFFCGLLLNMFIRGGCRWGRDVVTLV